MMQLILIRINIDWAFEHKNLLLGIALGIVSFLFYMATKHHIIEGDSDIDKMMDRYNKGKNWFLAIVFGLISFLFFILALVE